jgi:hydroxymethylpyrimidine/phosphomethylpyrimidine kinase
MTPHVVLTIAGSDSGAGAGIQADLKTFAALDCYGANVLTAITAQNTIGVQDVHALPANVVAAQLASVLTDFTVGAVKVGMVATGEIAATIAARARNGELPLMVLDPVLTASTGRRLGVVSAMERLIPYATVVTPNVDEASALLGWEVVTTADMAGAAAQIAAQGPKCVVITGGDLGGAESVDALWTAQGVKFLRAPRVETANTHGTGCTFSAAIAARLAQGYPPEDSVSFAKRYVRTALIGAADWHIGDGAGPLNHFVRMNSFGEPGSP